MLNMMSKILILCIIMCLASLSHAMISGSLDKKIYNAVEGHNLDITCTVNDRNNESIWWQVKYVSSTQYNQATDQVSKNITHRFAENFEYYISAANDSDFILRLINVSRPEATPTITCGYVPGLSQPSSQTFSDLDSAKIEIWVEPKCMYKVNDDNTQIKLSCSTEGYKNPSRGLTWYKNGFTSIGSHTDDMVETFINIDTVDYGTPYVCQIDSEDQLGDNLTCEIIIPSPTTFPPTKSIEEQTTELVTETIFMTQTTELALTETANQTNTTEPVDGFWSDMIILVVAAPGGTIVLILIIIIVVCLCSCIKHNKTNKNIDVESGSETKTKSDTKTLAAKTHDTATTNGGMKMNDTNEMKNGKTEMPKDDAIPVYDDVANEDNAEKTDKPYGEPMNNGQVKEAKNMDKTGEEIPLYDNMGDDRVEKPDMSKVNVEGLEYADIAIGSTMDGPPNSEDIIRKESATVYADLMV